MEGRLPAKPSLRPEEAVHLLQSQKGSNQLMLSARIHKSCSSKARVVSASDHLPWIHRATPDTQSQKLDSWITNH